MTAAPLRFPRPLSDIIRVMERSSAPPSGFDALMDEWDRHPEVLARQAEFEVRDAYDKWIDDEIDRLLAEQDEAPG